MLNVLYCKHINISRLYLSAPFISSDQHNEIFRANWILFYSKVETECLFQIGSFDLSTLQHHFFLYIPSTMLVPVYCLYCTPTPVIIPTMGLTGYRNKVQQVLHSYNTRRWKSAVHLVIHEVIQLGLDFLQVYFPLQHWAAMGSTRVALRWPPERRHICEHLTWYLSAAC